MSQKGREAVLATREVTGGLRAKGTNPHPGQPVAVAPDSSLDLGSVAKGSVCPAGHPGGVSSHGTKNISISDIH